MPVRRVFALGVGYVRRRGLEPGACAEALAVGRHYVMTHAGRREGGPRFHNVNMMGVAHGLDKDLLLAHKDAIDEHPREAGISIHDMAVSWGGRGEIKPSAISPLARADRQRRRGTDPDHMRAHDGRSYAG